MALRVVLLDDRGRITAANRRWRDMALAAEHTAIDMAVAISMQWPWLRQSDDSKSRYSSWLTRPARTS